MEIIYETFMGRLGKNPELKYTAKHEPVCKLSVAIDVKNQDKPDWKRVIVWGEQAESCKLYLKKGKEVFVQGRMRVREFKDQNGELRSITEWNARLVGFPNT
ncbi:single-strand binding family protein [Bacteriovorax sp. BAL6_X]|uniref:single-stranded DNA-binding protein n=1 Tax=Bacteriovorax sp. BAL6_X TaxID=1201290 RepID=UPI000386279E|nr:single-stranded DNA-binding protein [Bacteriovorax sp. BAL6_X]EPZ49835.1 single-strand binding family protein [Bacteriovorax sp. BAL6_X]